MNLLEELNVSESSLGNIYLKLQHYIAPLADKYHIAQIGLDISRTDQAHHSHSDELHKTSNFHRCGAPDTALTYEYTISGKQKTVTSFFPWEGYRFNQAETTFISNFSKFIYLIYSRADLLSKAQKAPMIDTMTGVLNNPGVRREMQDLIREHQTQDYAGVYFNLKSFKYVNNLLGSQNGDYLLRQYVEQIYHYLDQETELISRIGGDNFFVFIRKEHLPSFIERLTDMKIIVPYGNKKVSVPMRSRIGIYFAEKNDTAETILDNTSITFDTGKRNNRDITFFEPQMLRETMQAKKISMIFPSALRNGEFVPYYQPKVNISTNEICGCEALVRWKRSAHTIPPNEFIPALENDGSIWKLDLYMLEQVCKDLRRWLDMGLEPVRVSVNYSRQDLHHPNLVNDTINILHKYRIDSKYIELEITESSFYKDYAALTAFASAMHQEGIAVSMDDFGTGYSSLNLFKDLDFDVVKLDKSFINNLGKDKRLGIVLTSMINMLRNLNVDIVSEGVETPEQIRLIQSLNCNIVQGFVFDKPLPRMQFEDRLISRFYQSRVS
ncbi:MAG: GGDEF domain-containing phosphodiesterase [Lachnospiraceae bacterium]|nr:GGDEF domain-containing phosphodiesterase [Lachnospiraceae bacterium]